MILATTITITHGTVGTAAVMAVLALVCGGAAWAVSSLVVFTGMDNGSKFSQVVAALHVLLIVLGAAGGAYLGYRLMS